MLTANKPYVVTFDHADVPRTPDHSSRSPGPSTSSADRAGYTRATVRKRASIDWGNGPARADGMVPFFARAVTVVFALDLTVAVSSDYPVGSCPYRVTLRHEVEDHAQAFLRIFLSHRDILVNQLNAIAFPTERAPRWIEPRGCEALQATLGQQVRRTVEAVAYRLKAAMDADRQAKDSPYAYAAIYRQCPSADWQMRGR